MAETLIHHSPSSPSLSTKQTKSPQQLLLQQNPPEMKPCLAVKIQRTAGISDGAPANPLGVDNSYNAIVWIDPKKQRKTLTAESSGDPVFNEVILIPVESPAENLTLNLEVVRRKWWGDPGASEGITVVGRAKIPLSGIFIGGGEISKLTKLAGFENGRVVPKGLIALSFKLFDLDTVRRF